MPRASARARNDRECWATVGATTWISKPRIHVETSRSRLKSGTSTCPTTRIRRWSVSLLQCPEKTTAQPSTEPGADPARNSASRGPVSIGSHVQLEGRSLIERAPYRSVCVLKTRTTRFHSPFSPSCPFSLSVRREIIERFTVGYGAQCRDPPQAGTHAGS